MELKTMLLLLMLFRMFCHLPEGGVGKYRIEIYSNARF
jgi:hypothetical protein